MRFFLGFLGIAFGTVLVIKTEWFIQNFGTNNWAEQNLGTSGGTRLMYKLIGILIIFISMMSITGMLGPFVLRAVGGLFGI